MTDKMKREIDIQHVFIIGAKSIGLYGGYETFVKNLLLQHQLEKSIKYHIAGKANGVGYMDESELEGITVTQEKNGTVSEFEYLNAHVFKIPCPQLGAATALIYDIKALRYCISYCRKHAINHPIIYILACRIGLVIKHYQKEVHKLGGTIFLNPDGHEWMRSKWSKPIKAYWKWSEKKMVSCADTVICDSQEIKKYIEKEYDHKDARFIAYGASEFAVSETQKKKLELWKQQNNTCDYGYYLIVGRFVPENNYETMIREFMKSRSARKLIIITNRNDKLYKRLNEKLQFENDPRVCFAGTVYDPELLQMIREKAYAYLHGHEVGGTNPSLLEAMRITNLNLLLDVGFNREVGENTTLYWTKEKGDLSALIDLADSLDPKTINEYGKLAKNRINQYYSWEYISDEYRKAFVQ